MQVLHQTPEGLLAQRLARQVLRWLLDGLFCRRRDGLEATVVGVNCTFNEVIPAYREEYFQELTKMKFETATDESTVNSFEHLIDVRYTDDESLLEFDTTRVALYKGLIVAYRALSIATGEWDSKRSRPFTLPTLFE